ncbi:MAG: hypothetical protein EAX96_18580 [Candidatus Lokiarchaeota archaeon]|nr:hypothetical protein [Candidatus Lokiarchaeota archaeon]
MSDIDYYEEVRTKLEMGPLFAPKHEATYEIMKILWNEEEIKILYHFPKAYDPIGIQELAEKTGIPKAQLKTTLNRLSEKGTLSKKGSKFSLMTLAPGVFERYYCERKDTEENLTKAAVIFRKIMDDILPQLLMEAKVKLMRPLLPIDAKEKLIQIDTTINTKSQVLPHEIAEEIINKYDYFATVPCQCRLLGEYSGEPCKRAPAELGCLFCGLMGQVTVELGWGKELTKQEAIEHLRKAEKAGLVHHTVDDISAESKLFICNCCSCHCGVLSPSKKSRIYATNPSNYRPERDNTLCVKCGTCMEKCPMDAIFHIYPRKTDSSDEHMLLRDEYCIGCGVCAVNCPNNAIKMVKISDSIPQKHLKLGTKSFLELLM